MSRQKASNYTDEFKQQMAQLYNSGKPSNEIIKEYDLTASALHSWVKKYNKTGSFKTSDNLTPEQKELIELRKQNKQLLMENNILKQVALDISRSTYYSYKENINSKDPLSDVVIKIFNENQHAYGTRKLKVELAKLGYHLSRLRISKIVK